MSRKPIVAIVGRPNVGKSTFVNRLAGARNSIVDDLPGVTRDRIYFDVEWQNKIFTVIDTGGIIPGDEDEIMLSIFDQAKRMLFRNNLGRATYRQSNRLPTPERIEGCRDYLWRN